MSLFLFKSNVNGGRGGQTHLRASFWLNCPKTDLQMVCIFKFVHYGYIEKKLTLYVPWFISDGPLKFEVSN